MVQAAEPGTSRWRSYDDSGAIVDALDRGLAAALELSPAGIVFNLSIGAWAGSHHSSARVNAALTRLAARSFDEAHPMIFVVVGTGNAGADDGHFETTLAPGDRAQFAWRMGARGPVPEKLEVWSDQPIDAVLSVRGHAADEARLSLSRDCTGVQRLAIGRQLVAVGEHEAGRHGCLSCIHLLVAPDRLEAGGGPDGDLHFNVELRTAAANADVAKVHAWVERNCAGTASRLVPATGAATLTSLATAPGVISVAGIDAGCGPERVLALSGRGPAPWRQVVETQLKAPTLAAVGAGLWGARSKTKDFMRGSGTSAAAAMVSGAVVLAIEGAHRSGGRLDRDDLIRALIGGQPERWSAETGWGPLSFSMNALRPRRGALETQRQPSSINGTNMNEIVEGERAP